MTYTSEQIELMDLWLLTIIKLDISFMMFETFAQKQNISLELSNWTYYNVISVGHELGILNGYKSPSGKWKLIKIDKISCENFIEVGGFRKHFADMDSKFNIMQNFNFDQSIKVDNQSSLNMRDNISANNIDIIQAKMTTGVENSAFKKSVKIFLSIIKYIIIPLFIAFLIYKFGWTK